MAPYRSQSSIESLKGLNCQCYIIKSNLFIQHIVKLIQGEFAMKIVYVKIQFRIITIVNVNHQTK